MSQRITLILDDEARRAVRQLALKHGCSDSEAIRIAILRYRDAVLGLRVESRRERVKVLERLFELFESHDAEDEIRRLKSQDDGF